MTSEEPTDNLAPDQSGRGDEAYTGWAIVELMGHRVIAGQVSEAAQYGAAQLRVDVPGPLVGNIAVTQFYGGSAIYSLTPCTEEAARQVLENRHSLPEPVRLALPMPDRETDRALMGHVAMASDPDFAGDEDDDDTPLELCPHGRVEAECLLCDEG